MKKEVEIAKTNPNEPKLKKAAKEFGKYLTTAALTAALTLNPLSFGVGKKELIKEKPSIELVKKAYAEEKKKELPVVPRSEVLEAMKETEKLIKEGKVEEVKFRRALKDIVEIREWKIEAFRLPHESSYNPKKVGGASRTRITNKHAPNDATVFVTESIWDLAAELGIMDHELVKGYAVQRPDDPSQSILILAHKDNLNFYSVNDKGKIEWIPVILNKDNIKEGDADLKISKKPEVIILGYGENERGKFIAITVFDEDIKYKTSGSADLMFVRIYPKPNKPIMKDSQAGPGVFLAKIDLEK